MSSPEHAECEHFEERNSKFHNGILFLTQAYHMPYIETPISSDKFVNTSRKIFKKFIRPNLHKKELKIILFKNNELLQVMGDKYYPVHEDSNCYKINQRRPQHCHTHSYLGVFCVRTFIQACSFVCLCVSISSQY